MTFIQQAGMNKHEHICEALELFAADVMPEFKARTRSANARKQRELAPFIEAAMARKVKMQAPADADIPVFPALGRRITEEAQDTAVDLRETRGRLNEHAASSGRVRRRAA